MSTNSVMETPDEEQTVADSPVYSAFIEFSRRQSDTNDDVNTAARIIEEFEGVLEEIRGEGVEVRGLYDLTGFSPWGADVLVWLRGAIVDDLQWAVRQFRRTQLFGDLRDLNTNIVAELTLIDEEPLGWINFVPAAEADPVDQYPDADYDGLYDDFDAEEGDEVEDGAVTDELDDESGALVSLFAKLGIGELGFFVTAEANSPIELVGDLGLPFGDDLELDVLTEDALVGRWVNATELFEILR